MDINKTPNLFVGDSFVHVLASQKEHCCSFLLSCVAWVRGESPRWLSCASPHSPWGKIWEARGGLMVLTSGGDTLSFLFHVWASFLEDVDLCVDHRAPPAAAAATTLLDFVTTLIAQITLNPLSHLDLQGCSWLKWLHGWLVGVTH